MSSINNRQKEKVMFYVIFTQPLTSQKRPEKNIVYILKKQGPKASKQPTKKIKIKHKIKLFLSNFCVRDLEVLVDCKNSRSQQDGPKGQSYDVVYQAQYS